jgi:murein DD-endopeptidase MepM/ murein hydrolase activator NlpD
VSVTDPDLEVQPAVQQHHSNSPVRGRHRRTALHSHRAPSTPFGERGRYAMVTAALLAGVGVAGVTAATAGAHPADPNRAALNTAARAQTPVSAEQAPIGVPQSAPLTASATPAPQSSFIPNPAPTETPTPIGPPLAWARAQQKERPVVVVVPVPAASDWVNPMPEGRVTSCFGMRKDPLGGSTHLHAGVDLAAPNGTRIRTVGAGTVLSAGAESGYGNAVLIDHGNGYLTHYGHMSAITVKVGQRVAVGAQIGNEGSTGHSTGPHLHFEVHKGTYKNPIEPTAWMHEHGVDIVGCVPLTNRKN